MHISELDTPFLTVDLDAVERNLGRLQSYCDEHGFAVRPHIKTHKLPVIAHMQMHRGGVGIACQKLGEAEAMAAAGLDDILVTFPLIGQAKQERLGGLARAVKLTLIGDSVTAARSASAALVAADASAGFLVECENGFRRSGLYEPRDIADLAALASSLPGLRFTGLLLYPTLPENSDWLDATLQEIERAHLRVEVVSGGGTPTAYSTHLSGPVTEVRAGTYALGDRSCIANGTVPLEDCAARVVATVVSRPTRDRAIIDAGTKALSSDAVEVGPADAGYGLVLEHPASRIYALHEEHGFVDASGCDSGLDVGDTVTIVPNHVCTTVNMHDEVAVHRGGTVAGVWPVSARGKIR